MGLLRKMIQLTSQNLVETSDGFIQLHVFAGHTGEDLSHEERLGEELLNFAGTVHDLTVLFREFVQTKNRDDVLEFLVALQGGLHGTSSFVVLVSNNCRLKHGAGGIQRIHSGIDALGG